MEFSRRLTRASKAGTSDIVSQLSVVQDEAQEELSHLERIVEELEERIASLEAAGDG